MEIHQINMKSSTHYGMLLLIIGLNSVVFGQFYGCSTDAGCQALLNPSCDTFLGFCNQPWDDSDCNYLGTDTGYMVTISGTALCTRTCSSHSDCTSLPTAKICRTTTPNYCVECLNTDDCTAMGFKNHNCNSGFCAAPNPSGTDCYANTLYCASTTVTCFSDTIRCWYPCTTNGDCTDSTCVPGVTPLGDGVCSLRTNLPSSISPAGCTSNDNCATAAASHCSGGNCVACSDDLHCAHLSSTPYCEGGTCRVCRTHNDCPSESLARCDPGTYTCTACSSEEECFHFLSTAYCEGGICRECKTSDNQGCSSITASRCTSTPSYSCIACTGDEHCTHLSSTPYCEGGTCSMCKTADNTGCLDPTSPKCISTSIFACGSCLGDGDCTPNFLSTPLCVDGECRQCDPTNNYGCSATASKCDPSSYTCTPCSDDEDCNHLSPTPYCESGTCRPCKTTSNIGCDLITAPRCDSSTYICTFCLVDADCEHLDPNKYCESGTCRPCKTSDNSGCTTLSSSKCDTSSYTCVVCSVDGDCGHLDPNKYCVAGTCRLCKPTGNIGCNLVTAPRCDSSTYTCTTCLDDTDCNPLFSPYSYCEGGSCVICKTSDNSGCTMPSPKCVSTPSYACTACTVDMDCSGPTPYCESNSCATCKTSDNSGCGGSTPFCVSGTCRTCKPGDNTGCTLITASKCEPSSYTCTQCSADADCTHLSSTPYCEGNTCRSCKTSDNSGCTSITASKCDPSSYSCTSCSADEDCDNISSTPYCEGSICVTCKVSDNSGCSDPNTICSQGSGGNSCESNSGTTSCPSNMPPIGGTFNVAPGTGGLPLSTSYSASLTGWVSQNGGTLSYALEYIKATPLSSDPVQISDFSVDTQYDFYLPYTSIATIRATILDESSCSKNVSIDVTLNLSPPNGTDLLQTAKSFLNLISLAEAPTSAMNVLVDQINIANQLLLCANDLDSSKCNATQMMSCGTSGTCSNHGICTQLGCVCNEGYYLRDCSLERFEYELQTQLRQGLINSTVTSLNEQNIPEMMSILNALTQKPYLNTNSTLNLTLNAVTQAIQVLNSSSYDNANLAADIQDIADVISNAFDQITTLDCSLYNNFSLRALNQSYDLLQQLSDVFVKSASDSSETQLSITTNAFLMFFGIYDSSELNNLQINMNENAPQIQISSIQNQASLPPSVALTYIYLKKDPLKCGDTSPATNFTLEFKNAETLKEIHLNASILVTYPQSTFGQVPCPARCFRGNDPEGNRTCFCTDISIFDVKNQLGRLYRESNLHLLTLSNIAKMFTSAIYLQWSFWVVVVSLVWLIVTLIVVKTGNKDYCLAKKVRRKKHKNASRSRLGKNFMYFAVIHPLLGIYFYGGRYATSKAFRALIYFVRVMSLLGTSAVFMKNPDANEVITLIIFFL